jgi:uncharacterized protein with ATP-grasp and redox domains
MRGRLPAIVRAVSAANADYPAATRAALEYLATSVESDAPIPMCDANHPAADDWARVHVQHAGETWLNSEWLYAETFFYRHVIDAVDWWTTARDPYAPHKREEEANPALWATLERALSPDTDQIEDKLMHLFEADLWGNKSDLSYNVGLSFQTSDDDWLTDDRARVVDHLLRGDGMGVVHLITDNYGTELACDFALIDGLLDDVVERVTLHVKGHPTYVSDATREDAHDLLRLLSDERRPIFKALGDRLAAARMDGRLTIQPDWFWNSPHVFAEMPARIYEAVRGAALIISKGDANYRRITDDRLYPPTTPFADVLAYAPAPICALRTMKSDAIIGLQPGQAEALDARDPEWRTNGRRGLIQFKR